MNLVSDFRRQNQIIAFMHTANTIPWLYFMLGMPLVLIMEGYEASTVGMFQLAGMPAVFKLFWALPVDRFRFQTNHYKKWAAIFIVIYMLVLLSIATLSLQADFYLVFGLVMLAALLSTFIDIPLSALSIKIFDSDKRLRVGGCKSAALFIAFITGGGIMLFFYNHFGWASPLLIMAAILLISLFALLAVKESDDPLDKQQYQLSFRKLIGFFRQSNTGKWSFFLLFYFSFIAAAWIYIKPLLLAQGFSADEVALSVGIWGGLIGATASMNSDRLANYFSKSTLLGLTAALNVIAVGFTSLTMWLQLPDYNYYISVTLVACGVGFSSAIIFAIMMDYARDESRAIDYGLQSSLMTFARILFAAISGSLLASLSYPQLFAGLSVALLLVMLFSFKFAKAVVRN